MRTFTITYRKRTGKTNLLMIYRVGIVFSGSHEAIEKMLTMNKSDKQLSRAAAGLLIHRLSFNLHCWWPCIVHCRLTCHPTMEKYGQTLR